MEQPKQKPILVVQLESCKYELYLLNPGEFFAGFGGSRHGLQVRKTASLVVRQIGPGGLYDAEHDIDNANTWEWIQKFVNFGIPEVQKRTAV